MIWTSESISSLRLLLRHQREANVDLGLALAENDSKLPEVLLLELMFVALHWPQKRQRVKGLLHKNGLRFPMEHLQVTQMTRAGWDYWSTFDRLLWDLEAQYEDLAVQLARYAEQNWGYGWLFLCHKLPRTEARRLIDKRIENKQLSLQEVKGLPYPPALIEHEGIEQLRLENCGFPHFPDLCQMKTLKVLSLSNDRHEVLPDTIAKCTQLEKLNIYASRLRKLPPSITALKQLKQLDLSYCSRLQGLPDYLGQLKSLHFFSWRLRSDWDNRLHQFALQQIPPALMQLQQLRYLKLPYHKIRQLEEGFAALIALEYLDLRYNGFDRFPNILLKLENLKNLKITLGGPYASMQKGNQLVAQLPLDWGKASQIEQLDLSDSWLRGGFESLAQLPRLRHLRLYDVKSEGEEPRLSHLRQLLPHCKIEL